MEGNPMTASITALSQVSSLLGWSTTTSAASSTSTSTMPSWSDVRSGVLSAVSTKLGISQSDLTAQLKTGKSMADVATAAGVSTSDLTATIQGSLETSGLPAGINFATMANRMANNVNNASIDDEPSAAATAAAAAATKAATSTTSALGIDTSSVSDVNVGGTSLDSSEISVLLGGSTGSSLDTYL